jgi:hypothetical protein
MAVLYLGSPQCQLNKTNAQATRLFLFYLGPLTGILCCTMNATTLIPANTGSAAEIASYVKAAVLFILLLVVMYVFTTLGNGNCHHGDGLREPLTAPYWIPYVGNTIGFVHNTESFLLSIL